MNQLIININKYMENNTMIIGEFNTPLTTMDRYQGQKSVRKQ